MQKRDAASDEELSEEEELEVEGEFSDSGDDESGEDEGDAVTGSAGAEDRQEEDSHEVGAGEDEEGEEEAVVAGAEEAEEEQPAPPLKPQRKRLEPFEVPKSGVFWLHDDRFDPAEGEGEEGGRGTEPDAEMDERQKERGKLWDPSSKERWGHDGFEALERGDEPMEDMRETFGRMRVDGRGRGRGGRFGDRFGSEGEGRGPARGRGGRNARGGRVAPQFDGAGSHAVVAHAPRRVAPASGAAAGFVGEDEDFPPPGFEHRQPGGGQRAAKPGGGTPAGAAANGRGPGRGTGRGAGRGTAASSAPKVLRVPARRVVPDSTGPAATKSPGANRRRRDNQLNVEAQNFQPGKSVREQAAPAPRIPAPAPAPVAPPAPAYAAVAAREASAAPAPANSAPYYHLSEGLPQSVPQQQYYVENLQQQQQQQPAPAAAAAQMGAQQSAAALQQIAMGGGFAPTLVHQPMQAPPPMQQQQQSMHAQMHQAPMQQQQQPMHSNTSMPQQAMQYMAVQQPMPYAAAPGMQPGYAYVAVPYSTAPGMQVPTYQPAYQPMEAATMPAAPLPPQAVKRPLTISAPEDGSQGAQQQPTQAAYHAGYGGEYNGEALPQRSMGAGAGRRYSAVASARSAM